MEERKDVIHPLSQNRKQAKAQKSEQKQQPSVKEDNRSLSPIQGDPPEADLTRSVSPQIEGTMNIKESGPKKSTP